jgi:hypothetical protein
MEFQMRNKTFISSMVGIAAAMSVAGSANAAFTVVDNFSTNPFSISELAGSNTANAQNAAILPVSGSSNRRQAQVYPTSVTGSGTASASMVASGSGGLATQINTSWSAGGFAIGGGSWQLNYGNNSANPTGTNINLTSYSGIRITGSGSLVETGVNNNRTATWDLVMYDTAGQFRSMTLALSAGSLGNLDFGFSSLSANANFNMASISKFYFLATVTGMGFGAASGTQSLSYNIGEVQLVPAPGALALLGVAGIVGARRRRA